MSLNLLMALRYVLGHKRCNKGLYMSMDTNVSLIYFDRLPRIVEKNDYQPPEEFVKYADELKDVITNRKDFNAAIQTLKKTIDELLQRKFEGKGDRYVDMFSFDATSVQDWTIELTLGHQYNECVDSKKEPEVLELYKKFISVEYKDKIEKISIDKIPGMHKKDVDGIRIKWKSPW